MLYVSLIHPHLVYANFILEGTTKSILDRSRVHQNNALRAVLKADFMCPSSTLTTQTKVEPVHVMMIKWTCKLVYKGLHNIGAPIYNEMFNYTENVRSLRSTDQLLACIPKTNTRFAENNVRYRGPIHWNSLPLCLKQSPSFEQFKKGVKEYCGFG